MNAVAAEVIKSPEDVTAEWLTERLRANRYLDAGEVVEVSFEDRTKKDRMANRILVRYSEGVSEDLPSSLIFRFNDNGAAKVEDKRLCSAAREAVFYTQMASEMDDPPFARCYDAGIDEKTGETYLLLEDLTGTHELAERSENPSPYGGWACFDTVPRESWEGVVDALVQVQAHWWDHARIHDVDITAISGWLTTEMVANPARAEQHLEDLGDLPEELRERVEQAIRAWPRLYAERIAGRKHLTLTHQDFHCRNVMLPRDPAIHRVIIFDWETLTRGIGVYDLAYLMTTPMLPAEMRYDLERHLISRYHAGLVEAGIVDYRLEDCLADYRLAIVGLVAACFGQAECFTRSIMAAFEVWGCAGVV